MGSCAREDSPRPCAATFGNSAAPGNLHRQVACSSERPTDRVKSSHGTFVQYWLRSPRQHVPHTSSLQRGAILLDKFGSWSTNDAEKLPTALGFRITSLSGPPRDPMVGRFPVILLALQNNHQTHYPQHSRLHPRVFREHDRDIPHKGHVPNNAPASKSQLRFPSR